MRNKVYGITVQYLMDVIYVEFLSSISIFSRQFLFENSSLRFLLAHHRIFRVWHVVRLLYTSINYDCNLFLVSAIKESNEHRNRSEEETKPLRQLNVINKVLLATELL